MPESNAEIAEPVPYYSDNLVTLYHGDCREILPTLPAADLVLTDPPYGINYVSNSAVGKGTKPITNDGARLSLRLYRSVFPLLRAQHVLWFTRWDAWPDVWVEMGQWFPMRGMLIWDKGSPGMGDLAHWGPSYEMIASAGTGKIAGSRDGSILRHAGVPAGRRIHPTEKPTSLLAYLIGKLDAGVTLDPFAGSGSTLSAARSLGRKAVGIEFDESYCEGIAKRLATEDAQDSFDLGAVKSCSTPDPTDPTDLRVPSFERVTHIDFGESENPTPPGLRDGGEPS